MSEAASSGVIDLATILQKIDEHVIASIILISTSGHLRDTDLLHLKSYHLIISSLLTLFYPHSDYVGHDLRVISCFDMLHIVYNGV